MIEKTVSGPNTAAGSNGADGQNKAAQTRESERYLVPPVDIFEANDGLMVVADLPGVDKQSVDVRVDQGILTIHARARQEMAGNPIYSEFGLLDFYRQFQLSEKVDQAKITAEMKNGVLALRLPKVEEAKPRQIPIQVG